MALPAFATSAGFNTLLPLSGIHQTIATGQRERSSFKASLTSVTEGSANPTTDVFGFWADWMSGYGTWINHTGTDIMLTQGNSGTRTYTDKGNDYRARARCAFFNLQPIRVKGSVDF